MTSDAARAASEPASGPFVSPFLPEGSTDIGAERCAIRRRHSADAVYVVRLDWPHADRAAEPNAAGAALAAAAYQAAAARATLADAELARISLRGIDLADSNLAGANLAGTDFTGANLADCNLAEAVLAGARLAGTNLTGANMAGANLAGADLTDAALDGASLIDCILADADLTRTGLAHANLARAQGIIDAGWPAGLRCVGWKRSSQIMVFLGDRSCLLDQVRSEPNGDGEVIAALEYLSLLVSLRGWR